MQFVHGADVPFSDGQAKAVGATLPTCKRNSHTVSHAKLVVVPDVDVVDSTWVGARPAVVGAAVARTDAWARWWPGLQLVADELRDEKGVRWTVERVTAGPGAGLAGSAEVWLEPTDGGTVAHFFLRLDPPPGRRLSVRAVRRVERHYHRLAKRAFWALGDQLDPGRTSRLTTVSHAAGR
jgi:hypothetical protein